MGTDTHAEPGADGVVKLENLYEIAGGDEALVIDLINIYLESASELMERMARALAAGNDFDELQIAAHSLKSNSASIGAEGMSRRCYALETMARNRTREGADRLFEELKAFHDAVTAALKVRLEVLGKPGEAS